MTKSEKKRLGELEAYEKLFIHPHDFFDSIINNSLYEDAENTLVQKYSLTKEQAAHVLHLPLGAMVGLNLGGCASKEHDRLKFKARMDAEEVAIKETLRERQHRLNKHFDWSNAENVQKIIDLNNGLLERYREAYNELLRVRDGFEARYRAGDKNYKDYTIEVEFWYSTPDSGHKENDELWENLLEETQFWGPHLSVSSGFRDSGRDIEPFEEAMMIDDKSWNEYPFCDKALDGTYIYYFMHDIFNHNDTYSLEDAVLMKAEDFSWQLKICLEHWGASVSE